MIGQQQILAFHPMKEIKYFTYFNATNYTGDKVYSPQIVKIFNSA